MILFADFLVFYCHAQVGYHSFVLQVFLILQFVCQVLVQAQLIKSEPQLNPATVMYTTAPVADVTTSSGTPTPAPASIHTLVNTAHGAILATGELRAEVTVIEICDLMFSSQRPILYCYLKLQL
jgi:hypothetical protein